MTTQTLKEEEGKPLAAEIDTVEAQISAFAQKLGIETEGKFSVYIYRMVKDEETGRYKKPFIKKYIGVEPDPQEIAEKFRGGTYLISFCWKKGKEPKSRSYTLDIDSESFPPLPKPLNGSSLQITGNPSLSESMQMQLITMQTIGEIMKEAYRSGNPVAVQSRGDPLEQFSGIMEAVETSYSRAMAIQSKIMERVFARSMEKRFGLTSEGENVNTVSATESPEPSGIVGQYTPIIKEVVEGLKTVIEIFGEVPKNVIQKVKGNERFKALISDERALVVVGQALRHEFGDSKASDIMKSFGVRMVVKPQTQIRTTPEIPAATQAAAHLNASNGSKVDNGLRPAPRPINGKVAKETAKERK